MPYWLGVDTGGTFTDFVLFDGEQISTHKVLSTPAAPERAILQGIRELGLDVEKLSVVHGSTVATNAVLEGKGVRTVYIANQGLKDVILIGRQARKSLYDLQPPKPVPLIDADDCLEVPSRLAANGEALQTLDDKALQSIRAEVEKRNPRAVAINLLFSYLDNSEERRLAEVMPDSVFVSRSSAVLNEYREYERGLATCLNSYVGPLMQDYLRHLAQSLPGAVLSVMQSNGGTIGVEQAGEQAVHLLLSGPAGGLKGAWFVAANGGERGLLSFDMGGTSTDVALINGDIELTSEGRIADYPVAVPMVDMHTIGAGGGSIARVDSGGLLLVGPQSAGADPGPACYGKGGQQATVTDANVVLGRIPASQLLGGDMPLDKPAAIRAVSAVAEQLGLSTEQAAEGIIRVANEHMARALRVMSVQRGLDPREFSLASFGGAGGLHVCALADVLQMHHAVVPVHGGVLSALGMLVATPSRELSHTINRLLSACEPSEIQQAFEALRQKGQQAMLAELSGQSAEVYYSVDMRYRGQSFTLNVAWSDLEEIARAFHQQHEQRYGHTLDMPLELVNLRVGLRGKVSAFDLPERVAMQQPDQGLQETVSLYGIEDRVPVYQRDAMGAGQLLTGPALVIEQVSSTYVASGWQAEMDRLGNLLLYRRQR